MAVEELPAAHRATEQSQHFHELMKLIRSRTDATAKGLAAVGTAAVSAIGYRTLADVFPFPGPFMSGHSLSLAGFAVVGLAAGIVAMVFAVIKLVQRFEAIAETIITYADAERTQERSGLQSSEFETLTREYKGMAKLNQVDSLAAYNARAHRLERIADASPGSEHAGELRARADAIRAEILAVQDRAVVYILRERAKQAFFHRKAIIYLLVFLGGWYLTALCADGLQSERAKLEADSRAPVQGSSRLISH